MTSAKSLHGFLFAIQNDPRIGRWICQWKLGEQREVIPISQVSCSVVTLENQAETKKSTKQLENHRFVATLLGYVLFEKNKVMKETRPTCFF